MSNEEGFVPYEVSDYHWKGLDPDVQLRATNLAQDFYDLTGEKLKIRSGFRSTQHQAALYAADPNSGYVAEPGSSGHERGVVIDLDKKQVGMMPAGMIEKYFNRPLMGQTASGIVEPWHLEHPDYRTDPIFNTRGGQTGGGGVLSALSNLLGPKEAGAAEGPQGAFDKYITKPGQAEAGGGGAFDKYITGPGSTKGLRGNIWAGIKEGVAHSAGKFMAEAAQGAGPAHDYFPSHETGNELIGNMTPEYGPGVTGTEKFARAAGGAIGSLPEYMIRSLPLGGVVPALAGLGIPALMAGRMAASSLPFALQSATEPGATGAEIGAAGGAGAALPWLHPLPWYLRAPVAGVVGAAQSHVAHPEGDIYDKARSGTLLALMSLIGGRQGFGAVAAPKPGAEVPPPSGAGTQPGRTFQELLAQKRAANQQVIEGEFPKPAEPWAANQRTINQEIPTTLSERNQAVIDRTMTNPPVPTVVGAPLAAQEPSGIRGSVPAVGTPMPGEMPQPAGAPEAALEMRDLDRRIAQKFNTTPSFPEGERVIQTDRLGVYGPRGEELPKVEPAVVPTPEIPVATPQPQPLAPFNKHTIYTMAKSAGTFEEFNKSIGERPLPAGVPNLQEFYNQVHSNKPAASKAALETADITAVTPIDDMSYGDLVSKLAKSEVVHDNNGKVVEVKNNWGSITDELQQASRRFNTATFDHHFNPLTLLGRLTEKIGVDTGVDAAVALKGAKEIIRGYGEQVWKPFRSSQPIKTELTAAAPIGGLLLPEGKPPSMVGETAHDPNTGIRSEFHVLPDPETPGVFRMMRQDFRGEETAANPFSVATGTKDEITRFMQSTSDMKWQSAAKYGMASQVPEGGVKMYSGGPDTTAAFKAVWSALKPFAEDYKARLVGKYPEGELGEWLKNARDLNGVMQIGRLPFWVGKDYPTFQPINDVSSSRMELAQMFKNDVFREKKAFYTSDLSKEQLDLLDRKTVEGGAIGDRTDLTPEQTKQAIMDHREGIRAEDPAVYEAYMSARKGYDLARDRVENFLRDLGLPETEINELRNKLGFQLEYFPHVWDGKKYFVQVEDPLTGTKHRTHTSTASGGNSVAAEYRAQYGPDAKITTGKNSKMPDDVFNMLTPEASVRILQQALDRAKTTGDPETIAAIKQNIVDTFKTRGAMERFTERQNVGGYRTSGMREISRQYDTGMAGFIAKLDAAPKYLEALSGIDSNKTPNLYDYGRTYVRDVMRNESSFDQMFGTWRALMFHQFLGVSLRAAAVNLTQNWVAFAPWMAKEGMSMPEIKVAIGMKDVLFNWDGFRALLRGEDPNFGGNIKPAEKEGLVHIFKSGALEDYNTQEMLGSVHGKGWGIMNEVATASRSVFGTSESLNRVASALTAFRFYLDRLEKEGVAPEAAKVQAANKASEAVMSSHYLMGKYNLPEFARGGKLGTVIRSTGYQFKGFTHNYLEMLAHLFHEDPKAALRSMGTMAALAGPLAIPIINEARHIYNWATGTDPLEDAFENKEQSPLYTALKYGLPGFLEADIAGSIGAQVVRPDTPGAMAVNTLLGPLGSIIVDSIPQAASLYNRGAGVRSLEPLAPVAVKNVLKAYRESTEGVTTTRGQAVMNEETMEPAKLSFGEGIQQGLGFRPTSASTKAAQVENLLRRQQGRQESQDRWASQYVRAISDNDEPTMERILDEVDRYNEWATNRSEPPIKLMDMVKEKLQPKVTPKSWQTFMNERR